MIGTIVNQEKRKSTIKVLASTEEVARQVRNKIKTKRLLIERRKRYKPRI